MEIEGTRQAFAAMIQERGIFRRLGVERSTVATWKIYLREGKNISLDKMEEMLIKGGAAVKQEKIWEVKAENEYTQSEIEKIANLLDKIRSSWKNDQISLRTKLRNEYNFTITNYVKDQHGYSRADLFKDIKAGKIIISGD